MAGIRHLNKESNYALWNKQQEEKIRALKKELWDEKEKRSTIIWCGLGIISGLCIYIMGITDGVKLASSNKTL